MASAAQKRMRYVTARRDATRISRSTTGSHVIGQWLAARLKTASLMDFAMGWRAVRGRLGVASLFDKIEMRLSCSWKWVDGFRNYGMMDSCLSAKFIDTRAEGVRLSAAAPPLPWEHPLPFPDCPPSPIRLPSPLASVRRRLSAIVPCRGYGPHVKPALKSSFDLIGGIDKLVRNKTVTIKINLTGSDFSWFLGWPTGETYMTHSATVMALLSLLFASGASRVRLVESTQILAELPETLDAAGWDVNASMPWARWNTRTPATSARAKITRACRSPPAVTCFQPSISTIPIMTRT